MGYNTKKADIMAENKLFAKFQKDAAKPAEVDVKSTEFRAALAETVARIAGPNPNAVSTYNPLAVIQGGDSSATDAALLGLIAQAEERPSIMGDFPLVTLIGGESGGMMSVHEEVDEDTTVQLPMGTKAFTAVYLGYRLVCQAWPKGDRTEGVKVKPLFAGEVGSGDTVTVDLLSSAARKYQFTKKIFKVKFDGVGHVRMGVELLFYKAALNGSPLIYVLRLPSNYSSAVKALEAIQKALPNGKNQAFPARVEPYVVEEKGATAWPCHTIKVSVAIDDKGNDVWGAFQKVRPEIIADEEFSETLAKWNMTTLTEENIASLKTIAGMR
jgi:hypothetical protein